MSITVLIRVVPVVLALGTPVGAWAGGEGRGVVVPPPGGAMTRGQGGGAIGHARSGLAASGAGHVQTGLGRGGAFGHPPVFGHTDTARRGGVARRSAFGHVNTALGRREATRFALRSRRGFAYGSGISGGYVEGGYAGDDGAAGGGDRITASNRYGGAYGGSYGTTETGDGPLGPGFAEPPLNAIGPGEGPLVLSVHGGHAHGRSGCACDVKGEPWPVVYRFGIGSYY